MEQRTLILHPSAPLENNDLERRLGKNLSDLYSFENSINNQKEIITYFKDKNNKSRNRYKKYKTLNTILESVDTIVIIEATSTSKTLSITGVSLNNLPTSAGIACTRSLGNKVLHKVVINNYDKYKKNNIRKINKQINR